MPKVSNRYLNVQGIKKEPKGIQILTRVQGTQKLPKGPRYPIGTYRLKVSNRYLKVEGIQKVLKGPRYLIGT